MIRIKRRRKEKIRESAQWKSKDNEKGSEVNMSINRDNFSFFLLLFYSRHIEFH